MSGLTLLQPVNRHRAKTMVIDRILFMLTFLWLSRAICIIDVESLLGDRISGQYREFKFFLGGFGRAGDAVGEGMKLVGRLDVRKDWDGQ